MKYSYNLLSELVDLKNFSAEKLAEIIDAKSFEVEAVGESRNLGIKDWTLTIETGKTNRVDVLGHWGLASEVSAITGRKLKKNLVLGLPKIASKAHALVQLKINPKLCRKYAAWEFTNVKVRSSPAWLRSQLTVCGLKPINNVVDIANYVMLLVGQPLHAFDAKRIYKKTIQVRRARNQELLKTLDGESLKLEESDIVIAGPKHAIALGGIKGGEGTAISKSTTEIILEAANFFPVPIRRTSWRLGLRTDAAARFEKNLPPQLIEAAFNEASDLLVELAGAVPKGLVIKDYSRPRRKEVILPCGYVEKLLGYKIAHYKLEQILKRLNLEPKKTKGSYRIQIPFFRPDINLPEDIVEEIGRIRGYENIPEEKPLVSAAPLKNRSLLIREQVRDLLRGLNFTEVYNYSFYSKKEAERYDLPLKAHFELCNPLSLDQELLRISLLPALFKTAFFNIRFWEEFSLFEFGNVYLKRQTKMFHDAPRLALCFISRDPPKEVFMNLKGRLSALFQALHIEPNFVPVNPKVNNRLVIYDQKHQMLGLLDVGVVEKRSMAAAELNWEALVAATPTDWKFKEFSRMPKVTLDVAIAVDKSVKWLSIETLVRKSEGVQGVKLFDVYEGPQVPAGRKSLAFSIVFQNMKRTLSDEEVNTRLKKLFKKLNEQFGAKVRNGQKH